MFNFSRFTMDSQPIKVVMLFGKVNHLEFLNHMKVRVRVLKYEYLGTLDPSPDSKCSTFGRIYLAFRNSRIEGVIPMALHPEGFLYFICFITLLFELYIVNTLLYS